MGERIRLNKYCALCRIGSRRHAESLIMNARIAVNGKITTDLSTRIDTDVDVVALDGRVIRPEETNYYILLNKPRGYLTARQDVRNRPVVTDLIPERFNEAGVFPVGRLDMDSEGLLLLTNDGELTYRLTHPRFSVEKVYHVELDRELEDAVKAQIEKGVFLYDKKTLPAQIRFINRSRRAITIILHEGRKRQIREIFKKFGYRVLYLKRISYGPITLRGVSSGGYRLLSAREIRLLRKAVGIVA